VMQDSSREEDERKKTRSVREMEVEGKTILITFFSSFIRLDKEIMPFHRGAWLRLYDIPFGLCTVVDKIETKCFGVFELKL
jgi:hypothetical protein